MSERYTIVDSKHGLSERIRDNTSGELFILHGSAARLNRLAAEVATLRELLRKAYSYAPIELASEIYAVIQPTMESP